MNNSTKAKITALLFTFGATSIAPTVMAGQEHGFDRGHNKVSMMRMMRKLDLTDEQQIKAKDLVKSYKQTIKNGRASKDDRKAHFDQMQRLMKSASFDEQAAHNLISQNKDKRINHAVSRLKLQHDLYQLLTPEQQVKADELKTKYVSKHKR